MKKEYFLLLILLFIITFHCYCYLFFQAGDVRVSFSYAGYSGKQGSRFGDPMVVRDYVNLFNSRCTQFFC